MSQTRFLTTSLKVHFKL